jgi:STE24 endopeptidase
MSSRTAALLLVGASLACATLVGLVGRAPAALREVDGGRPATDPELGARFTNEQRRRAAAYNGPGYLALGLGLTLRLSLLTLLALGPWSRLVDMAGRIPGGWPVRAALLAFALVLLSVVVLAPLGFVRGFAQQHAWGLSTQSVAGWLGDRLRSLAVSGVVAAIAAVAFFGIIRWQPRSWWLWGWAAFTALSALFVFVWPVLVAPLFNRFTPLQDPDLARRSRALARAAGVHVDEILVADASRRTTAENAYVAGFGDTKRLVLYDTLLEAGDDSETLWVVGHELGHEAERHVLKGVALTAAGLLVAFAALAWAAGRPALWSWSGASGIDDLRSIPVLLLFATLGGLVGLPVENAVSRSFERRADEIALEVTGDPDTAVSVLRRIALRNLSDLTPPGAADALLYPHPPTPERIERALSGSGSTP